MQVRVRKVKCQTVGCGYYASDKYVLSNGRTAYLCPYCIQAMEVNKH